MLYYVGVNGNVLELTPPLGLTTDEVETGVSLLERAVADVIEGRVAPEAGAGFGGWR